VLYKSGQTHRKLQLIVTTYQLSIRVYRTVDDRLDIGCTQTSLPKHNNRLLYSTCLAEIYKTSSMLTLFLSCSG